MRRSSLLMLAAAIVLGLVAVFVARYFLLQQPGPKTAALPTVPAVVASQAIAFGEKLTAEKLKVVQYPAEGLPAGTFQRVVDAAGDDKVALRAIEPNELITDKSLSGKAYRLAAAKLFEPEMRAVAIPINEQSGVAGHIVAGDRIDLFMTRDPGDAGQPFTEQLAQNVRVLAVGQNPDVGRDKPDITRTITLEVTPLQAQRISLAETVGTFKLALRNVLDESRVVLQTAQLLDLNDGTVTRIIPRKKSGSSDGEDRVKAAQAIGNALGSALRPGPAAPPPGPTIEVFRGGKPTSYPVPRG